MHIIIGTLDYRTFGGDYGIHLLELNDKTGELKIVQSRYDKMNPSFTVSSYGNNNIIYATSERVHKGSVVTYRYKNNSNELALESVLTIPTGGCVHAALSPEGKYILLPSTESSLIYSCELNSCGIAEKIASVLKLPEGRSILERQTHSMPHQVVFDKTGQFIAAPDLGQDRIHIISFDGSNGSMGLLHSEEICPGAGPRHAVFHHNNEWLYLFNEFDNTVYVFDFDQNTGNVSRKQIIELLPEDYLKNYKGPEIQGAEIRISPDGRYVFASVRGYLDSNGEDSIVRLSVNDQDGTLSEKTYFSCGGKCPRIFDFTPDGNYLICCNQLDNQVVSFRYDNSSGYYYSKCGSIPIKEPAALTFV